VASEEVFWLLFDFSCAPGWEDSTGGDEVDCLLSLVSPVSGCGGAGVLGVGVLLQAVNHSPARKVDINIRHLILFSGIFKRKIGSGCHQSQAITVSNIRFCKWGVKPGLRVSGIQWNRPKF
jgi:hypothetical protein